MQELDIDNLDTTSPFVQKLEKGLKNRKKEDHPPYYDEDIDKGLLDYLIKNLVLSLQDNLIPGGSIHNFRHFMDFPIRFLKNKTQRKQSFDRPLLAGKEFGMRFTNRGYVA